MCRDSALRETRKLWPGLQLQTWTVVLWKLLSRFTWKETETHRGESRLVTWQARGRAGTLTVRQPQGSPVALKPQVLVFLTSKMGQSIVLPQRRGPRV